MRPAARLGCPYAAAMNRSQLEMVHRTVRTLSLRTPPSGRCSHLPARCQAGTGLGQRSRLHGSDHGQEPAQTHLFPLSGLRHRHSGLPAIHHHPGLHDHLAPGRDDDADPAHHPAAVRPGGVVLRLQRRRLGPAGRRASPTASTASGCCSSSMPASLLGTLLCALAATYPLLLAARIVTGLFGGVIGSVVLAIATDLFPLEMRGRVMGFIQTAFAASQVLGLPAGLYLRQPLGLARAVPRHPRRRSCRWAADPVRHEAGRGASGAEAGTQPLHASGPHRDRAALPAGLHPHHAAAHRRLHADAVRHRLYGRQYRHFASPPCPPSIWSPDSAPSLSGPLVGKASDSFGKFNTFCFGSAAHRLMVAIWTNLGRVPLATVIVVNVLLFIGIFSRMIPSQALISADARRSPSAAPSTPSTPRCSNSPAAFRRRSPAR